MLSVSQLFVRIFSRLTDGRHTASISLDDDATRLRIQVFSCDGVLHEGCFNDEDVSVMKLACHPAISWQSFFELVQKAFAENTLEFQPVLSLLKITLKHERQTDAIPFPAFTSSIIVSIALVEDTVRAEASLRMLCDTMISHVTLRNGEKREADRIDTICRQEAALHQEAEQLATEVDVLTNRLCRVEKELKCATNEYASLLAEPRARASELGFNAEDAVNQLCTDASLVDMVTCRVVDPLGPRGNVASTSSLSSSYCKVYDETLLRLIKSRHCLEHSVTSSHHACDVLKPFAAHEISDPAFVSTIVDASAARKAVWTSVEDLFTSWDFDVASFHSNCLALVAPSVPPPQRAGALFVAAYAILFRLNCVVQMNMSERRLLQFLSAMEASYLDVPFHNSLYAADVLQAMAFFISNLDAKKGSLRNMDVLSGLLAAIMISVNHHGLDDAYHIKAQTTLASTFSHISVLEAMRVAYTFELMKLPRYDILYLVDAELKRQIERTVEVLLVMTDSRQFETLIEACQVRLHDDREWSEDDDRRLLLSLMMKSATMAFTTRASDVCRLRSEKLVEEYKSQGAAEEAARVNPSTPFRGKLLSSRNDIAKLHLYTVNFIAAPTLSLLSDVVPSLLNLLGPRLAQNVELWMMQS